MTQASRQASKRASQLEIVAIASIRSTRTPVPRILLWSDRFSRFGANGGGGIIGVTLGKVTRRSPTRGQPTCVTDVELVLFDR